MAIVDGMTGFSSGSRLKCILSSCLTRSDRKLLSCNNRGNSLPCQRNTEKNLQDDLLVHSNSNLTVKDCFKSYSFLRIFQANW